MNGTGGRIELIGSAAQHRRDQEKAKRLDFIVKTAANTLKAMLGLGGFGGHAITILVTAPQNAPANTPVQFLSDLPPEACAVQLEYAARAVRERADDSGGTPA